MARRPRRGIAFADDELDTLIVGLVLLDRYADADAALAEAAEAILARIAPLLPDASSGPAGKPRRGDGPHHGAIRAALAGETTLRLRYVDRKDAASERTIWPIELGFVGGGETLAAWCERRRDFRHFRLDRIVALEATGERYAARRRILAARLRVETTDQGF